jgi:hypothetical protein
MSHESMVMRQEAPYPTQLADLVDALNGNYKPGYQVLLYDDFPRDKVGDEVVGHGLTLGIIARVPDSIGGVYPGVNKGDIIRVQHLFIVPAATYNRDSWMRWLLNRCIDVETHETCEFFQIDGERPFAPHHGNGEDPYTIWHHGTDEQRDKRAGQA